MISRSFSMSIWSGWLAGSAIGALMVALYWVTNKQLGISTAYGYACQVLPGADHFRHPEFRRTNRWRLWFGLGIPLGAVLAGAGDGLTVTTGMGPLYEQALPQDLYLRGLMLLAAGTLMGLGARMAGGCTSGHVISGVSLLNRPSLLAGALFFLGGLLAVQVLFLQTGA
ncbi:MAG: YeeE/YedE thiosulfate transporter family protein [Thiohalomonadaceae bacterium]